jgi:hypothetical protein
VQLGHGFCDFADAHRNRQGDFAHQRFLHGAGELAQFVLILYARHVLDESGGMLVHSHQHVRGVAGQEFFQDIKGAALLHLHHMHQKHAPGHGRLNAVLVHHGVQLRQGKLVLQDALVSVVQIVARFIGGDHSADHGVAEHKSVPGGVLVGHGGHQHPLGRGSAHLIQPPVLGDGNAGLTQRRQGETNIFVGDQTVAVRIQQRNGRPQPREHLLHLCDQAIVHAIEPPLTYEIA